MNLKCSSFLSKLNINRNASLSYEFTLICKNAFWVSLSNKYGDILALMRISQGRGCRAGPVYMHSLMLDAKGCGFALASKTILVVVAIASCLTIGLWGK